MYLALSSLLICAIDGNRRAKEIVLGSGISRKTAGYPEALTDRFVLSLWAVVGPDAAETESCGLRCDARQDLPLGNLSGGCRKRLLGLCCPPSATERSRGVHVSPRKQHPAGEAHQRLSCIWVKNFM